MLVLALEHTNLFTAIQKLEKISPRKIQDVMSSISKFKVCGDLSSMYDNLETQLDSLNAVLDKSTLLVPLIVASLPADLSRVCSDSVYDEKLVRGKIKDEELKFFVCEKRHCLIMCNVGREVQTKVQNNSPTANENSKTRQESTTTNLNHGENLFDEGCNKSYKN
ncbi:hypothetical protein FQR65_LT10316 [Abscondita terminalis]|nr:hypothetical protein FQR65_LT10316 [Abscondita terminalis]